MRSPALRAARVGDHLPHSIVDRPRVRRLDATALLVAGAGGAPAYIDQIEAHADDFAAWDGPAP